MEEHRLETGWLVFLADAIVVLLVLLKSASERLRLPPLLAYMLFGFALRVAGDRFPELAIHPGGLFSLLAALGLFALLFHVGLDSDLKGLVTNIRPSLRVWGGNMAFCATSGYVVTRYIVGADTIPSAVVACALTATSVSIPVRIWDDRKLLNSKPGRLFVDAAILNDLSGILLLSVLVGILPALQPGHDEGGMTPVVARSIGWTALKIVVFAAICYAFSRFAESRLTALFGRLKPEPDPMLVVAGVALMIAALADVLGLSLAIGGFLAGLTFSRDPKRVRVDASFTPLYELLTPFFFLGLGLNVDPGALTHAVSGGFTLAAVAVGATLAGTFAMTRSLLKSTAALALSLSMVPRAEIFMVIAQRSHELGEWALDNRQFAAMALASVLTSILVSLSLDRAIARSSLN